MARSKEKKSIPKQEVQSESVGQKPITGPNSKFRVTNSILAILLGVVSFIAYANTLSNGFVLDDHIVIKDNHIVTKGITAIPEILTTPYLRGWSAYLDNDLYRPVSLVLFSVEYQLFGLNPLPFHFMNILLFAGCVILLFLFLNALFQRKKTTVAFIAAFLFALHPIHTEVVANIKSRDELLCFLFSFSSLIIFIRYMETGRTGQLIIGGILYFLSLLSKETSITFLAVIPLVFFFYANENKKRAIYITSGVALMAALFIVLRFSILKHYHADHIASIDLIENALSNPALSLTSRIATAILILGHYIRLLFIPYPLIVDYSFNSIPYAQFTSAGVIISLAFYIFLGGFAIYCLLKKPKDPYAFAILFFLISISLFTNIPFLVGATMAERFMFFGSAGFCLAIALFAGRFIGDEAPGMAFLKKPVVFAAIIPLSVIYLAITVNRNADWYDNITLYTTDLAKSPNNARLNYYVADETLLTMANEEKSTAQKKLATAIADLKKAIELYPAYANAHLDLGIVYANNNLRDSAIVHYKKSLSLNPKQISLLYSLAGIYFDKKQFQTSIEYNKRAIEMNPGYAITYANTGLCYLFSSRPDSAIYYAEKSRSLDPKFPGSYEILATAWKAAGNTDSAGKYDAIARKNNPNYNLVP